jgi:hypothetical protein
VRAGIPAGTKLSFSFIYNAAAPVSQQARDLASDARQAGIRLNLSASSFNYLTQYDDTPQFWYLTK